MPLKARGPVIMNHRVCAVFHMFMGMLIAVFAWEAYEKGTDAHVQADPTKLELLAREFNKRKDTFIETKKESILDKYGGEEHLDAPSKQLLLAQTV